MVFMHDIIPHLKVRKVTDFLPLIRLFLLFALLFPKNVRLGNHDKL